MRIFPLLCGALLLAAAAPGAVAPLTPASAAAARCPAEIVVLPQPPAATSTMVSAMNDGGWVVGTAVVNGEGRIMLWRNGRAPLDLGSTDRPLGDRGTPPRRERRSLQPFDINDNGVIALSQGTWRWSRHWRTWHLIGMSGVLLHRGTTTRLAGTAQRPWAWVTAINDHGLAVGYISEGYPGQGVSVPVVWRHGTLERLPIPPRARVRGGGGYAYDVNNRGLVVGSVGRVSRPTRTAWWWRLGGGHGSLHTFRDETIQDAQFVDNHGRIVGYRPDYALWPGLRDRPRRLLLPFQIWSMTGDAGYIAGTAFADRGGEEDRHAYIGRTTNPPQAARLPFLPDSVSLYGAPAVGRGLTAYAPHGGVTVGGTLTSEVSAQAAVLWTCAQTYLP